MSTQTDRERERGIFDAYKATREDYALYSTYSTVRLRLLAWFGDPVARRILAFTLMARDTKEHAADKDGLAKNLDKFGKEFDKVKDAVRNAGDSHDPFTNAAVEASRASPYFMGHVLVIGGVILVGIIIALIALN